MRPAPAASSARPPTRGSADTSALPSTAPPPQAASTAPKSASLPPSVSVTNTSSTGTIAARNTVAAASASTSVRSSRWRRRWPRPARRRRPMRVSSGLAIGSRAPGPRSTAATANEAASRMRAAGTPASATTAPPISGPAASVSVNATPSSALPSRSRPSGRVTATTAVLTSARALTETTPSANASARISAHGHAPDGGQGKRPEQRGLGEVQGGKQARRGEALERGNRERREQSGDEAPEDPQRGNGQHAPRLVQDQQRQRDLADPVADVVDRVRAQQPAVGRQPERAEGGRAHEEGSAGPQRPGG